MAALLQDFDGPLDRTRRVAILVSLLGHRVNWQGLARTPEIFLPSKGRLGRHVLVDLVVPALLQPDDVLLHLGRHHVLQDLLALIVRDALLRILFRVEPDGRLPVGDVRQDLRIARALWRLSGGVPQGFHPKFALAPLALLRDPVPGDRSTKASMVDAVPGHGERLGLGDRPIHKDHVELLVEPLHRVSGAGLERLQQLEVRRVPLVLDVHNIILESGLHPHESLELKHPVAVASHLAVEPFERVETTT